MTPQWDQMKANRGPNSADRETLLRFATWVANVVGVTGDLEPRELLERFERYEAGYEAAQQASAERKDP